MSSVTQPLSHGQEASGMEAALAPWFQRYDTMMVVLSPFHCFCQKYSGVRR